VRALVSFIVAAVAVVVQVTIVDRITFPGGAGPNVVLLAVAALALAGGPLIGALTGFWAGLALDVAPPGSHFAGQNALVFCLVGYACGLLADESSPDSDQGHTALFEILVTAAGAVVGEALSALLGVMLSDPRVTWTAIHHVLPVAVAYDILLCPFVLYAVAAALRLAGSRGESPRAGWTASQVREPAPSANQGAIRQLAAGSSPRLRLSERDKGSGPAGGLRGTGLTRREPQLKFGRPAPKTVTAAFAAGGLTAGASKVRFGGRRREGALGGSRFGGASAGSGSALRGSALRGSAFRGSALRGSALRGSALRGSALRGSAFRGPALGGARFGSSTMGRSLLGGSVFRRSSASLGATSQLGPTVVVGRPSRSVVVSRPSRSALFGRTSRTAVIGRASRSAPLGRTSPFRPRGNALRRAGLAGSTPRFSRGGRLTRLTAALRRSSGPKSPGRGWLHGASTRRGSSLRGTSLGGRSTRARLRMPRPKTKRRWRTRKRMWRTGGYR
jgi:rod shape-determining protein MreD